MTAILVTNYQRFIGLSTDTKPTAPAAGSTFYETDSGATYVYDSAAWQLLLGSPAPFRAQKTITFTGAANLGAIGNVPLFTVTGEVAIEKLAPFCPTTLVGVGATLALGVAGATALFIAASAGPSITGGAFWVNTTPPSANGVALPAALKEIVITDNIVGTVAVAAITAGVLRLDCYWRPLSSDGKIVAA